jgi:hypothetical protein
VHYAPSTSYKKSTPFVCIYVDISCYQNKHKDIVMVITILQLETQLISFPHIFLWSYAFFLLSLNMYSIPVSKY